MKKTLVTTAICLIGVATMMAQGRINFANSSATPLRISANPDGSGAVTLGTPSTAAFGIGPGSSQVRLFAGLTSSSLAPVLIGTSGAAQFVVNSASSIATFQGTFPGGSNLALAGYDGSAPVFLQFTADSINGAYRGVSPIIQVNLATGVATATTVFSANPVAGAQWNGLTMTVIPEPSSMALAGLGAAALVLFRRRK